MILRIQIWFNCIWQALCLAPKTLVIIVDFLHANESYCSDSYYQALTLGMQLEFKTFYKTLTREGVTKKTIFNSVGKGFLYITPLLLLPS